MHVCTIPIEACLSLVVVHNQRHKQLTATQPCKPNHTTAAKHYKRSYCHCYIQVCAFESTTSLFHRYCGIKTQYHLGRKKFVLDTFKTYCIWYTLPSRRNNPWDACMCPADTCTTIRHTLYRCTDSSLPDSYSRTDTLRHIRSQL